MAENRRYKDPLAYQKEEFLHSPEARSVRILSEYLDPLREFRLHQIHDTIIFFGSARIPSPESEGFETSSMGRYYKECQELACRLTEWSMSLDRDESKFVVCTGGGPGIMEAANRGASEAGGSTIGLNIGLPMEQFPNPYITPDLSFEFHYFFMRKFWFAYLAKAMVVFPGGFGTLDELMELLTLTQTRKLRKKMVTVLYGTTFWQKILNFDALVEYGMISPEDLELFQFADDVDTAFQMLRDGLTNLYLNPEVLLPEAEVTTPAIASSRV
ncbi:TIGR00730 family Rossman fold protein [Bryobacter aggregatus]|uniref:LOG family protein n=1 Tax=Bryobacter aggregatus TaxID=360054 RepID=UPI0004E26B6F|nr:TIGR00730 family Rossman fold protein [Bryobacter aggregatus]